MTLPSSPGKQRCPAPLMGWTARPTVYNGVRMRSRLEAAWAEQFDAFGWPWKYEPQVFASELGQYLPDFRVQVGKDYPVYVEVKPHTYNRDAAPHLLSIIRASEPLAELWLALGANRNGEAALLMVLPDPDPDSEDGDLFLPPRRCSGCFLRGSVDLDGPDDHAGGCLTQTIFVDDEYPMVDEVPVPSLYAVRFRDG